MLTLCSLGIVLAISRRLRDAFWAGFALRGKLIFSGVVALLGLISFCALTYEAAPFTWFVAGLWAAIGLMGWFHPELLRWGWARLSEGFRAFGRLKFVQQLIIVGVILSILLLLGNQQNYRLVLSFWILGFGFAIVWKAISESFKPAPKPASKRRRR